jgi:hypothetical protein
LNPTSGDEFGHAVSGHGDRLLVSAFHGDIADRGDDGIDAGRAAVFVYENGGWRQEAELSASDLHRGSKFGESVLLLNDTAIVGTPGATVDGVPFAGAVYVFGRIGGEWKQTQRITAPVPFVQDEFGYRMAASGDIDLTQIPLTDFQWTVRASNSSGLMYSRAAWRRFRL